MGYGDIYVENFDNNHTVLMSFLMRLFDFTGIYVTFIAIIIRGYN